MELSACGRFAEPALVLLLILDERPKDGPLIAADVSRLTGRDIRPGTLYGTIARLEQTGLVESAEGEDRRRTYWLTAAGHAAARDYVSRLSTIETSEPRPATAAGAAERLAVKDQ
jgi:DNA-binding PadR family transcriptional regulator